MVIRHCNSYHAGNACTEADKYVMVLEKEKELEPWGPVPQTPPVRPVQLGIFLPPFLVQLHIIFYTPYGTIEKFFEVYRT